jgi:6,7-dimethyl-8-ribityllumazine synthase
VNVHPSVIDAGGLRFAVVAARFNHLVSVRLLEGCTSELIDRGAAANDIDVVWVPGAFEIPQAARLLAATGSYAAIVTLGAVIRGGTPHFDFV